MEPTNPLKPGAKTSEFYVTLALLVLPLINHVLGSDFTNDEAAKLAMALVSTVGSIVAAVLYILGRIKLKRGV